MARGDHIYVLSFAGGVPFQHHGIDMGDGSVIHLASSDGARVAFRDTSVEFCVRRNSWEDFCRGKRVQIVHHDDARQPEEVAATAESMLGQTGYSLLEGNCEHFATFCATGRYHSQQIELSEATVSAMTSLGTKAFWSVSSKLGSRVAVRGAVKIHPAAMLADGGEIATLLVGCRNGISPERSRRLAKLGGLLTAAGVGVLVGGPAGAVASVGLHTSSGLVADNVCKTIRRLFA